uniref:1.C5.1 n=1 Tax=Schmidtea mediterranea TaxID=79327 RepID=V9XRL6_SCHMD|nr:1.C5.1 [Schmidtea mediterranea]
MNKFFIIVLLSFAIINLSQSVQNYELEMPEIIAKDFKFDYAGNYAKKFLREKKDGHNDKTEENLKSN